MIPITEAKTIQAIYDKGTQAGSAASQEGLTYRMVYRRKIYDVLVPWQGGERKIWHVGCTLPACK